MNDFHFLLYISLDWCFLRWNEISSYQGGKCFKNLWHFGSLSSAFPWPSGERGALNSQEDQKSRTALQRCAKLHCWARFTAGGRSLVFKVRKLNWGKTGVLWTKKSSVTRRTMGPEGCRFGDSHIQRALRDQPSRNSHWVRHGRSRLPRGL